MKRKLALWLSQRKEGMTISQGVRILDALAKTECTKEMYDCFCGEVQIQLGREEVSQEEVLSYLEHALMAAQRSIEYWELHPRDINARFFKRAYDKLDWDEISSVG